MTSCTRSGGPRARHLVPALAVATLALLALAPPASATRYAGAFMADGGGARALGMGSAFVAVADDASATFWNPAGLLDVGGRQLLAMHSERFGDLVDRDFVSYVQPRGESALGFAVLRLGVDDIPFTEHLADELDTNGDGTVDDDEARNILGPQYWGRIRYESDQEWAFLLSYATRRGGWQWGGSVKGIMQSVGSYSSWGLGVDLGLLRRDWWRQLDVGVKLQDATSTYLSWNTGRNETISPVLVPGVSWDLRSERFAMDLLLAAATELHFDGRGESDQFHGGSLSGDLNLGAEASLGPYAQLRLGSHGGFDAEDLTWGIGLRLSQWRVDYARAGDVLDIDENTHRVSLAVDF